MRDPQFILILGARGTGKTTDCIALMESKLKTKQNRVLIINPNDATLASYPRIAINSKEIRTFEGVKTTWLLEKEDFTALKNFSKGMLLIDDCRRVINSNVQGIFNELFIDLRHRMIDLVLVAHGITQVPPSFFTFINSIILHKTTDSPVLRKNVLGDMYESYVNNQQIVNNKAIKNPYYKTFFKFQ